jgi:Zn-dependent M16 (insulinase) family peptidase
MGFATQGKVQYVSTGVNLKALGLADDSRYILLNQLLSTGFLWERVRVQGGAYGCFLSYNQFDGILNITSYRDPNLRETLDIYKELADHLRKLELSEEEFEKIVIGTFGRIDAPLSPSDKGGVALTRYLSGVNTERMQRRRDELLTATLADIRALADWFEALNENALICVHGSAEKVNEAASLFDRIEVLAGAGGDDDDDEDDDDEDDFCK